MGPERDVVATAHLLSDHVEPDATEAEQPLSVDEDDRPDQSNLIDLPPPLAERVLDVVAAPVRQPPCACGEPERMVYWACNIEPVGTGPFVLESWKEAKELVFARNPHYWQTDRPLLDRLIFPIVPRDGVRSDMLRDGDAHLNLWLTPDQIEELQEVEGVHLVSLPSRDWTFDQVVYSIHAP